ncbi:MAG: hypothetical protein ACI8T1_001434 [Verrucomicrobiales bacterium]
MDIRVPDNEQSYEFVADIDSVPRMGSCAHYRAPPIYFTQLLMRSLFLSLLALSTFSVFITPLSADILISEVMTDNEDTLLAADGSSPDWLELHNDGAESVNLAGFFLTDDPEDLNKWELPSLDLAAGGFVVILASGDDLRDPAGELHTSFKMKNGGEFLALVEPDKTTIADAYEPEIPQLDPGQSYGVQNVEGNWVTHFFATPSPGAANSGGTVAEEVMFSVSGKAFNGSLQVELSSRSGTPILYSTDGDAPSGANSKIYSTAINLTETTALTAQVTSGPIHQDVYFSIAADLEGFDSNLPIVIVDASSNPSTRSFSEMLIGVIEPAEDGGRTSISETFSITSRGHMRIRGSSTSRFPKPSYRIEFHDESGDDRVVKPLGLPAESDWVLSGRYEEDRALVRNEFVYELSNQIGRYAPRTRFCEVYLNTSRSGSVSAGDYIGLFSFMESLKRDADRIDIDKLTPEHNAEPEVTGGYIVKVDRGGDSDTQITGGSQRVQISEPTAPNLTSAQRSYIQGYLNDMGNSFGSTDPDTGYPAFIDVDSFVDVHMLNMLMLNVDALRLSSLFHKPRGGKLTAGPIWDFNISSGSRDRFGRPPRPSEPEVWRGISGDRGTDFFGNDTQRWWGDLFADRDFQQAYCDRWNELRAGAFSTASINALIDSMADEVREAQARNEERWDEVPPEYGGWQGEIDHLKDWLATRSAWIDNELVAKPMASPAAGALDAGSMVTLTGHRNGTLYYTMDGSDPRASGGSVSASAVAYSDPFPLEASAILTIRERMPNYQPLADGPDQEWSAPATVAYVAGQVPASNADLAISEIMYHPSNPTEEEIAAGFLADDDFEYVELLNRGSQPIDLFGAAFDNGIQFSFEEALLLVPQARVVLVANRDAFVSRYGDSAAIAGVYTGRLANSGDRITLRAADGAEIQSFRFNDKTPWPTEADGDGNSLVLTNLEVNDDGNDAASWAASTAIGGTPGAAPGEGPGPVEPTFADVTMPGDLVIRIDGINDGDANAGPPPAGEVVEHVIDDVSQKYLNFLDLGSGFIVVPNVGPTILEGLRFYTANDVPERDPASYQLFGSINGAEGVFKLIAEGELALPNERNEGDLALTEDSAQQTVFFEKPQAYSAYQVVFPILKDAANTNSMQIAEVEFLGNSASLADVTSPEDAVVRVDGMNDDDADGGPPPAGEVVSHAIDDVGQKYLSFLDLGSGFTVSPQSPSVVTGLRLFTANDVAERDPASYMLEGSTTGPEGEFTVISEGSLSLPEERNEGSDNPLDLETSAFQELTFANSTVYTDYRLTFPTLKDAANTNSMQIAEVELLGLTAPATPSVIPGAIGYWTFDDRATTTADLSMAGNTGTVNGGASFILGHSGQANDAALRFDGVDDSVTTAASLLNELTEYTMTAWIRFDAVQAARTGLFGQNDSVEFGMSDAETIQHWVPNGGAINVPFTSAPDWTHIAISSNAEGRTVYLDGEALGTGPSNLPAAETAFTFNIGGSGIFDTEGNFFQGDIDDVAVWSQALTEADVIALANSSAVPGPATDPVDSGPLAPIASIGFDADGNIVLTIPEGETAHIEFSIDLLSWKTIGSATGPFQDDDASRKALPSGYYRSARE